MTAMDIQGVIDRFPDLTGYGFGLYRDGVRRSPADVQAKILLEQQDLLTRIDGIAAAVRWLSAMTKTKHVNTRYGSYGLKHTMEHDTGVYVSNGEFIVAAILAGFDCKPEGLNAVFNISSKSVKAADLRIQSLGRFDQRGS